MGKVLLYVKIHVKLPQVFTILREYSRNVCSAVFHLFYLNFSVFLIRLPIWTAMCENVFGFAEVHKVWHKQFHIAES